jgi:non-ribosomal peptide synthetase component F
LFQVSMSWQGAGEAVLELPGIQVVSAVPAEHVTVKFDLQLDLTESTDGIVGSFGYATALFDAATIERHRGYLLRALEAMVADESQPIESLIPAFAIEVDVMQEQPA